MAPHSKVSCDPSLGEPLKESLRCGWGADLRAVDEVDEAVPLGHLSAEALGPAVEHVRRVTGGFGFCASPQPSIDELSGIILEGRVVVVVDQGNSRFVATQQVGKGGASEAPVANFEDMPYLAPVEFVRQQLERR